MKNPIVEWETLSFSYRGKETSLSSLKPIDLFARDILNFIIKELEVKLDWIPKVKVIYCNDEFWMSLLPLSRRVASPGEYTDVNVRLPENWSKVSGFVLPVVVKDPRDSTKILRVPRKMRLKVLREIRVVPEVLAFFDATIFLSISNLKNDLRSIPMAVWLVVAHECVHIVEHLTQRCFMQDLDPKHYEHRLVVNFLRRFMKNLGAEEFFRRYAPRLEGPPTPSRQKL